MTYYMKMTKDMINNTKKYYDLMVKVSGSEASLSNFTRILKDYYNSSRYGKDTGIFLYDDCPSVCYGKYSIHKDEREYIEVKAILKNKLGGKIL